MSAAATPIARRLAAVVLAGVVCLAVSACGIEHRKNHVLSADGPQIYVNAGPLTYQVQITRALNPYSTEDVQYLTGLPNAQSLPPDQLWFGVFLWALNQSGHPQTTTDQFAIVDSSGTVYHPVPLPSVNPFAWRSERLQPNGVEPALDTIAAAGPTQGGLVLFKLSDSVYANRPLTLDIFAPGQAKPTTVTLDL